MKPVDPVRFLKTKEAIFLAVTGQPSGHPGFVTPLLEALGEAKLETLIELERNMDMMMASALPLAAREELAQLLKKQFGCSHLSGNPDLIIRRILRRRKDKIRTTTEAELVVNLLASVDDDSVTSEERQKLELILADFEKSRLPPGPSAKCGW